MNLSDETLITGDALSSLQKIESSVIHLGITSPPYNKKGKNKGWLVNSVVYDSSEDAMEENDYQQNQIDVLNQIYRITIPGGSFFYNHKIRWDKGSMHHPMDWLRKTKWNIKQEIVWDRMIAANIRGWRFWQTDERIYWLHKPYGDNLIGEELVSKDAKMTSVWRGVPERANEHPAPFPLWLPARVIISILRDKTNCVVLDPYVGSGTTVVAAKLLGHRFIGIDSSEKYIHMTENRLKNSESERHKILEEIQKHQLKTTFAAKKKSNQNVGKYRRK